MIRTITGNKRNVKATNNVTVMITVDVSDPSKMNIVQQMDYNMALMTLNNIHQALSHSRIKTKSHIDIETGEQFYQIDCRLITVMETSDEDVRNIGTCAIDASILLTTDSTGSLIAESSSQLVKLVQDIDTLCRDLKR